jgi:hypothetical protein
MTLPKIPDNKPTQAYSFTDPDYIREGVELADWFDIDEHGNLIIYDPDDGHAVFVVGENSAPQWFIDILAAQLVRQIMATGLQVSRLEHEDGTILTLINPGNAETVYSAEADDTIKCIVDWGGL